MVQAEATIKHRVVQVTSSRTGWRIMKTKIKIGIFKPFEREIIVCVIGITVNLHSKYCFYSLNQLILLLFFEGKCASTNSTGDSALRVQQSEPFSRL